MTPPSVLRLTVGKPYDLRTSSNLRRLVPLEDAVVLPEGYFPLVYAALFSLASLNGPRLSRVFYSLRSGIPRSAFRPVIPVYQ